MSSEKVSKMLDEVKEYLNSLSEEEREELQEVRFTAVKKSSPADSSAICFELVAAVPFTKE